MASKALEAEIGHGNSGLLPWSAFGDTGETVPELTGSNAIWTYNKMRQDAQIASLLLAVTLPIRRYGWYIDPNGARDETTEWTARNLNVPIEGQEDAPRGRSRNRFSHDRHLFHALLNLAFGHMFFEQVYFYDDSTKLFGLRKLAPRMPGSISTINVERDGGLKSIQQYPAGWTDLAGRGMVSSLQSPEIPVSSLVAYANEQEGGNWRGTSWLRALYRHWLRKDRLLRVDAINNERNGAGVPIAYAPPGASDQVIADLGALARSYRAGEAAGGGLPNGADLRFRGVEGTLPNILDSIRYDDEQMAARFFALAQEAIAKQYADVTNEHVIEDLVDINFSIDENAPLLKFDTETDKRYSVADLKLLIDAGALTPYPELEEYLRSEGDLPKPKDPEDQPEDQADDEGDDEPTPLRPAARTRIKAAMTVGGRTLRRNPLPHELKAAVDWDAMEEAWSSQQTSLVDQWKTEVNTAHADTLVEAIEAAETLDQLAALEAPVLGEQLMSDAMFALAEIAGRGCR